MLQKGHLLDSVFKQARGDKSGTRATGSLGQERDTWPWPTVAGGRQGRGAETGGGEEELGPGN